MTQLTNNAKTSNDQSGLIASWSFKMPKANAHVFYKQHFYKQRQTEIWKKLSKSWATLWGWTFENMSRKQVCLYQWGYMINCNENQNYNGKLIT